MECSTPAGGCADGRRCYLGRSVEHWPEEWEAGGSHVCVDIDVDVEVETVALSWRLFGPCVAIGRHVPALVSALLHSYSTLHVLLDNIPTPCHTKIIGGSMQRTSVVVDCGISVLGWTVALYIAYSAPRLPISRVVEYLLHVAGTQ